MRVTRVVVSLCLTGLLAFGGLFIAQQYSDAQVDENIETTTSCVEGVLSDDGQFCIVPRLDAEPAPAVPPTTPPGAPIPTFTG